MKPSITLHTNLPLREVPRINTRVLCDGSRAQAMTVWEQWMSPGGHIPLHYHDVEEVLVFLTGKVELHLDGEVQQVLAPATMVVPAEVVHGVTQLGDGEVHLLAMFPSPEPKLFAPDGTLRPMPWDDHQG